MDEVTPLAAINGVPFTGTISVGNGGVWVADIDLANDTVIPLEPRAAKIQLGSTIWIGTVDPDHNGVFVGVRKLRVNGGAGAWTKTLPAKFYHDDAGVSASNVAAHAAQECGETLVEFTPTVDRLGNDYTRRIGLAARALEDAGAGALWWVDYAGGTHVGARAAGKVPDAAYSVTAAEPDHRIVELVATDPSVLVPGLTVQDRLNEPWTIHDLEFQVKSGGIRARAYCGGELATPRNRVADLLTGLVRKTLAEKLWGKWRYRVISMSGARANLQAVRQTPGLPDLLPVTLIPGVAGFSQVLKPSVEVLVEFEEGDKTRPIIVGYTNGDVFVSLTIGDPSTALPAARQSDTVKVLMPPGILTGTLMVAGVPTPITGVIAFTLGETLGSITTGSGKVKIS